jgi:RimJ/RimL family protein N-acetyltransferase
VSTTQDANIVITGSKIRLRPFSWSDAERYRDWVNDPEIASLVDRVLPVTLEEHRAWYDDLVHRRDAVVFAVDRLSGDPPFVGLVWLYGVHERHRHAEVRIVIGEREVWGKGVGREALSLLTHYAFESLNLHKLHAVVLARNRRAVRSFEAAGFEIEGILRDERWLGGAYQDLVRLARVRNESDPGAA